MQISKFYNLGEFGSSGTRVFVQQGLHDAFLARLVEKTKSLKIGDPMDTATPVGALISKEHCEKVLGYLESGRQEGAEIAAGGGRPADPARSEERRGGEECVSSSRTRWGPDHVKQK